jgi:bacteriocin-like protein
MQKTPEELARELDNFEVTELDDKDLASVVGGHTSGGNTNCGCNGQPFNGADPPNTNCGC